MEVFRETASVSFTPDNEVAVKIVDAGGIESLEIIGM